MAFRRNLYLTAAVCAAALWTGAAAAETLQQAMASAYANNPDLNAARASTRVADEEVPAALAGYRPQISAYAQTGVEKVSSHIGLVGGGASNPNYYYAPLVTGLQIVQPIYTGGRTENAVNAAESSVKAARETLRLSEQTTLMDAVSAYMDVIATRQLLDLRKSNVEFLKEQVRAANDRLSVGEGTRTDVSQAEAALAAADAAVSLARSNLLAAEATYLRIVGHKAASLSPAAPAGKLLPRTLDMAVATSRKEHPAIRAALANADTAAYNVRIAEGALMPTVSITGSVEQSWTDYNNHPQYTSNRTFDASIMGRITIPIYQGGSEYASVRQAKELLGQRKIQVDSAREQVHASLTSAWGVLEAAKAQIEAAKAGVEASQLALNGVIEEQKVGQRTTLDVLDAQSALISAKVSLVNAQRDVVVASYAIVSATGHLDHARLGLAVAAYDPNQHYQAVRDKWFGLRTPQGD